MRRPPRRCPASSLLFTARSGTDRTGPATGWDRRQRYEKCAALDRRRPPAVDALTHHGIEEGHRDAFAPFRVDGSFRSYPNGYR